jgi:hypothetical protein
MKDCTHESGFSYLDVVIAVAILLVGVLALAGAMTASLLRVEDSEEELRAKQLATASVESVFSARDLEDLTFDRAKNVSSPGESGPAGVFLEGRRPIYTNGGADGIIGTADDSTSGPGPDGVSGTADDYGVLISGFEREIAIAPIDDLDEDGDGNPGNDNLSPISLRRIDVTIWYKVSGRERSVRLSTLMGNYRQENT